MQLANGVSIGNPIFGFDSDNYSYRSLRVSISESDIDIFLVWIMKNDIV